MENLVIGISFANLLAIGVLVFKAGGIVHAVHRHDHHVNNMRTELQVISQGIMEHGERIAALEAEVKLKRKP